MKQERLIVRCSKTKQLRDKTNKCATTIKALKILVANGEKIIIQDKDTGVDITFTVFNQKITDTDTDTKKLEQISTEDYRDLVASVLKKQSIEEEINFVDLFCGMGGLSSGLEMAGLNCIFGNDANPSAIKSFRQNHTNATSYCGSVGYLHKELLLEKTKGKKVHLVVGGPPCQGFSTIGRGDPEDERNSLFNHYCRVVDILKPEFVIFENVTGLLATKNQKTLEAILKRFSDLGYRMIAKILEAQHYGVPQKRKRTILIGTRLQKQLTFPAPKFDITVDGKYIPPRTLGDALNQLQNFSGELKNNELKPTEIIKKITAERIKFIPEGRGIRYKEDESEFLPDHLKLGVDWATVREGRLRELTLFRLARSRPSPTINTQNHHYYHPTENRRFTAREFATIQSFPLDYEIIGKFNAQLKQIGNAVPPLMAKALGEKIIEMFRSDEVAIDKNETISIAQIRREAFTYDNFAALTKYQSSISSKSLDLF